MSSADLTSTTPPNETRDLFSPSIEPIQTRQPIASDDSGAHASEANPTLSSDIAPTTSRRSFSPSPLVWNESGWLAGNFTFGPVGNERDKGDGRAQRLGRKSERRRSSWESDKSRSSSSTPSTSQEGKTGTLCKADVPNVTAAESDNATSQASKLAPTAPPFVFSPRPVQPATTCPAPSVSRLTPISTDPVPRHSSLPFPPTQGSFPLETPPHTASFPHYAAGGEFDALGETSRGASRYGATRRQGRRRGDPFDYFSNRDDEGDDEGREGAWTAQQQQEYNSIFSSPPYSSSDRSRSSSIASSSSLFGAHSRHSVDRNATVQQLASYFGPSPVDVAPPILPAGFDNFTPPQDLYSPASSRHGSISSFDSGVYPPLAHPEPFNLTPEDDLYIQAREIYTNSCCSTLKAPPPAAKLWEIAEYFDKAMNQENPLAALYGVNSEQTKGFYANPATSGLDETVVKVAAMRGRQNQMLSVQRSAAGQILPGPSPNNRKLELYKVTLSLPPDSGDRQADMFRLTFYRRNSAGVGKKKDPGEYGFLLTLLTSASSSLSKHAMPTVGTASSASSRTVAKSNVRSRGTPRYVLESPRRVGAATVRRLTLSSAHPPHSSRASSAGPSRSTVLVPTAPVAASSIKPFPDAASQVAGRRLLLHRSPPASALLKNPSRVVPTS